MAEPIAGYLFSPDEASTLAYLLSRFEQLEPNDALVRVSAQLRGQMTGHMRAGVHPLALGGALADDLLDAEQVAAMTNTSTSQIRRRCKAGEYGPLAARVGGVWVLHRSAIEVKP